MTSVKKASSHFSALNSLELKQEMVCNVQCSDLLCILILSRSHRSTVLVGAPKVSSLSWPRKSAVTLTKKVEPSFLLPRLAFKLGLDKNCRQRPFSPSCSSPHLTATPPTGNTALGHYSRSNPVRPTSTTPLLAWCTVFKGWFYFSPILYYVVSTRVMTQFSFENDATN